MAILDNLVSYWKLDESSGNAADSVGSYTLANTGVTYAAGKINNGAVFNATNDILSTSGTQFSFGSGNPFTFSVWVKTSSLATNNFILSNEEANPYKGWFMFIQTNGTVYCGFVNNFASSRLDFNGNTAVVNDNWTHLSLTYDGTANPSNGAGFEMYVNGLKQTKTVTVNTLSTNSWTSTATMYFGARRYDATNQKFSGMMDEMSIWSRALSAAEVAYLYNNGRGVQYPDMQHNTLGEYLGAGSGTTKGLYHLNGSSADYSGNGNNGTDTAITYSLANGKFGQGAGFNGSTSNIYSQSASFDFFGTANLTMSIWINPSALPSQATYVSHPMMIQEGTNTTLDDKGFKLYGDGSIGFMVYDVAVKVAKSASSIIAINNWYNIIGTYDGTNLRTYVNGILVGGPTAASGSYNFTTPRLVFAQKSTGDATIEIYAGKIDEAIVENVVWSAEKVKKYYTYAKGRFNQ